MSKKNNLFLLVNCIIFSMLVMAVPVGAYVYQQSTYAAKYVKVASVELEENVTTAVYFSTTTPTSTNLNGVQLVDVSNVNMFPHPWSGEVRVSQLDFSWEATGLATSTYLIGTIASTSASGATADIRYFARVSFHSDNGAGVASNYYQNRTFDFSPSAIRLGNKDSATARTSSTDKATTTGMLVGDDDGTVLREDSSTYFATSAAGVPMVGPLGVNIGRFGAGDLVLKVVNQEGTAALTVITTYHVK